VVRSAEELRPVDGVFWVVIADCWLCWICACGGGDGVAGAPEEVG
jgi:hypothetical protein